MIKHHKNVIICFLSDYQHFLEVSLKSVTFRLTFRVIFLTIRQTNAGCHITSLVELKKKIYKQFIIKYIRRAVDIPIFSVENCDRFRSKLSPIRDVI